MAKSLFIPNIKNGTAAMDDIERILRYQLDKNSMEAFQAKMRQTQIAQAVRQEEIQHFTALGQPVLHVDLRDFILWNTAQPGCWNDKTFIREFYRDNDSARAVSPKSRYV